MSTFDTTTGVKVFVACIFLVMCVQFLISVAEIMDFLLHDELVDRLQLFLSDSLLYSAVRNLKQCSCDSELV